VLTGLAARWLWRGRRRGAVLALGLVPVGAVFWWGFALPYPPMAALARTVLIVRDWPRPQPTTVTGVL
jgi:hypothetical protein